MCVGRKDMLHLMIRHIFSATHDFIFVYAKDRQYSIEGKIVETLNRTNRSNEQNKLYKNPDHDLRGDWASDNYLC